MKSDAPLWQQSIVVDGLLIAALIGLGTLGVLGLTVAALPAATRRIQRTMIEAGDDPAPGWSVTCTKCGRTRTLTEIGGIRYRATKNTRHRLGFCSACRKPRWLRIFHESRA